MERSATAILIVACLLVQTILGSVSPRVVVTLQCATHTGADTEPSGCAPCCGRCGADSSSIAVRLTPPCRDDCDDCVDVELPDDTMRADDGTGLRLAIALIETGAGGIRIDARGDRRGTPLGNGPPQRRSNPDGAVIRTARLLI